MAKSKVGRFFFYPFVRAMEQARESKGGIARAVASLKVSSDKLSTKGAVKNPQEAFEELYEQNEWTVVELEQQLKAVRRTKYFAMGSSVFSLLGLFYFLVGIPAWVAFVVVPIALFAIALGMVMAVKFTLFQEQIRRRSLITFKELLSEPDFFRLLAL